MGGTKVSSERRTGSRLMKGHILELLFQLSRVFYSNILTYNSSKITPRAMYQLIQNQSSLQLELSL
jgi:hypothetical protein